MEKFVSKTYTKTTTVDLKNADDSSTVEKSLFDIPVFVTSAKNNIEIKKYVDEEVVPAYLENSKRYMETQNNNLIDKGDFYEGAVRGGSMKHLSLLDSIDEKKKNDYNEGINGLSTVYSDYFDGALKTNQPLLLDLYKPDIEALMSKVGFKQEVPWHYRGYFWYAITEKGGSQDTHDHTTGPSILTFCGIHYVEYDEEDHEAAYFINPQEQIMRATYPSEDPNLVPDYFKKLIKAPKVKQGEIIWFPAWLKHIVPRQKSDKRRIAIALNISIKHD